MNNEYKKIVESLMAKGYSKLAAKRLAQQATTQLALSRMAMMEAEIRQEELETVRGEEEFWDNLLPGA
jgi:hypothetical protein